VNWYAGGSPGERGEPQTPPTCDAETPLLLTAGEEDWRRPPTGGERLHIGARRRVDLGAGEVPPSTGSGLVFGARGSTGARDGVLTDAKN